MTLNFSTFYLLSGMLFNMIYLFFTFITSRIFLSSYQPYCEQLISMRFVILMKIPEDIPDGEKKSTYQQQSVVLWRVLGKKTSAIMDDTEAGSNSHSIKRRFRNETSLPYTTPHSPVCKRPPAVFRGERKKFSQNIFLRHRGVYPGRLYRKR